MVFEPVVLEGQHVRLETLYESHKDGLCRAISDGELWKISVPSFLIPMTKTSSFQMQRLLKNGAKGWLLP